MVMREGTMYRVIIKCACPGQESLPERSKCLPLELESYFFIRMPRIENKSLENLTITTIFNLSWKPKREVSYGKRDLLGAEVLGHKALIVELSPPWLTIACYEARKCGYSLCMHKPIALSMG